MPIDAFADEHESDEILEKVLSNHVQKFILYPKDWHAPSRYGLTWDSIPFASDEIEKIPERPGLYAFSLQCSCADAPPTSYIMYIGIVGIGTGMNRHLKTRYKEYLGKQKRPLVRHMINKWRDHLRFYFVPVNSQEHKLEEIETYLLDKLIPPCNEEDFSGHLKDAVKVVRSKT